MGSPCHDVLHFWSMLLASGYSVTLLIALVPSSFCKDHSKNTPPHLHRRIRAQLLRMLQNHDRQRRSRSCTGILDVQCELCLKMSLISFSITAMLIGGAVFQEVVSSVTLHLLCIPLPRWKRCFPSYLRAACALRRQARRKEQLFIRA